MKKIEVAAAVIEKDGRVFATQRGYGEFKDGWEFPGGKLEPGEDPKEALIREIREELDSDIAVKKHLITVEHDYPKFYITMHCYLCRLTGGHLTLLEHEAAKWLDKDHLWDVSWLPADVAAVRELEKVMGRKDGDEE